MANLLSTQIKVFPTTRRTYEVTNGRLVTEDALTGVVRNLIDTDGFVATTDLEHTSEPFIFNIHGYYFTVDTVGAVLGLIPSGSTATSLYAVITLELGNSNNYTELYGQDENNTYTGVEFVTSLSSLPSLSSGYERHSLQLLEREDLGSGSFSDWRIPERSKIIFIQNSISIDHIDGGII